MIGDKPYTPERGDYRGNAVVDVIQPDGTSQTTWYYQNDTFKGKAAVSLTRTENPLLRMDGEVNYEDSRQWAIPAGQYLIERRGADSAIELFGGQPAMRRTGAASGTMVLFHFRPNDNFDSNLYLTGGGGGYGVCTRGSGSKLVIGFLDNGTCQTSGSILNEDQAEIGRWYSALFVKTENKLFLWLWRQDDPQIQIQTEIAVAADGFVFQVDTGGILDLDEYSEGTLYSLSMNAYENQSWKVTKPYDAEGARFDGPSIDWARQTKETHYSFEGNGLWTATCKVYQYRPEDQIDQSNNPSQYGNQTVVTEEVYNPDSKAWEKYRETITQYRPNNNTRYLVSLPALTQTFAADDSLQAERWFLYDGASHYTQLPTTGLVTAQRTLVSTDNGKLYNDERYAYDDWGNRVQVTQSANYGTENALASGQERVTRTCYGPAAGGSCGTDGYYTYAGGQIDAMGHATRIEYDYALGQPVKETDPNGAVTTARYDAHGRLTAIYRPGNPDDGNLEHANIRVDYSDDIPNSDGTPYQVDIRQKIDGSTTYWLTRTYDGAGQMTRVVTHGASLQSGNCPGTGTVCDITIDTVYDGLGRVIQQSVPYTHAGNYAVTQTQYDPLGRVTSVIQPDPAGTTTYTYTMKFDSSLGMNLAVKTETAGAESDENSKITDQYSDARGRVTQVSAHESVTDINLLLSTFYVYDNADRLVQATTGGAQTNISYDLGGRKTGMTDPDMGQWSYQYDALGNLTQQQDARGCQVSIHYDVLNRATLRQFDGALEECRQTADIEYVYDRYKYTHYQYGGNPIGRRTEMVDGTGTATWYYDARGRVTAEYRQVEGAGLFATRQGYNEADLTAWLQYPGGNQGQPGETVSYTYLAQKTLDSASGLEDYLEQSGYDAAGRWVKRQFGADTPMQMTRVYFAWNTYGGRLRYMNAGTTVEEDAFFKLTYGYQSDGNIISILDDRAGPQTQTFSYDALDRLESAIATDGENGVYSEAYEYAAGNGLLASKKDVTLNETKVYVYGAGQGEPYHGVTSLKVNETPVASFAYDDNGNMTSRPAAVNGTPVTDTLTYDGDNHLVQQAAGETQVRYSYDGDGKLISKSNGGSRTLYIGNYLEVEYNPTATPTPPVHATWTPAASATRQPTSTATPSLTPSKTNTVTPDRTPTKSATPTKSKTPTRTPTRPSGSKTPTLAQTPVVIQPRTGTPLYSSTPTKTWTPSRTPTKTPILATSTKTPVPSQTPTATVSPTITLTPTVTSTPGRPPSQVWKLYYFAGNDRIAMRVKSDAGPDAVYYLFSDHLGSTSEVRNEDGSLHSRQWYKAFGEARYRSDQDDPATASLPTEHKYTGQLEIEFGLVHFGPRAYDPALGRWLQPDTIIPLKSQGIQAWDRYAYSSNNPTNHNDPTGHCIGGISLTACLVAVMAGGAIGSYITQVSDNMSQNPDMDFIDALTTNISGEKMVEGALLTGGILVAAVTGAVITSNIIKTQNILHGSKLNVLQSSATRSISQNQQQGRTLLSGLTKDEFRDAIQSGIEGLSEGQLSRMKGILGKGKMENLSVTLQNNGTAQIVTNVKGGDGKSFVQYIYTIDPTGKITGLLQTGYNAAGEIIHEHDKFNDTLVK